MKVSELIGELTAVLEREGDLPVRLQCDHGQSMMNPTWVGKSHIAQADEDTYMTEGIADEDLYEYPDAVSVCEIQAF